MSSKIYVVTGFDEDCKVNIKAFSDPQKAEDYIPVLEERDRVNREAHKIWAKKVNKITTKYNKQIAALTPDYQHVPKPQFINAIKNNQSALHEILQERFNEIIALGEMPHLFDGYYSVDEVDFEG